MMRSKNLLRRERMEIAMTTLIDMYIADKMAEGLSPKTTVWYRDKLTMFTRFITNGTPAKLVDFTLEKVKGFIADLQARDSRFVGHTHRPSEEGKLSTFYIHGFVRSLKAFASWLSTEEFTKGNVLDKLKRPRLGQPMIEVLTKDELEKIMKQINPDTFMGGRMLAVVMLLLDTGIRASELCNLTLTNTHLESDSIKVLGKGNKERIVCFGAGTKKALLRYISTWRPQPSRPVIDNVFLTAEGNPYSYSALEQCLKRLGVSAGVPRLRAHLFRHSFSVNFLVAGGDIMSLKMILGHTSIEVTQVYLHLAESFVNIQQKRYSPVDMMGLKPKRRS